VEVGAAPVDHELEEIVDVEIVAVRPFEEARAAPARLRLGRRAVDHVDRARELFAIGDRRDDLVGRGGTDRRERLVIGGLRERDDELVVLEVDRQRHPTAREIRGEERRRFLVDRRLEEVDERQAQLIGQRGGQVLRADEAELEEHVRKRLVCSLGFFDRGLEAVT